MSAELTYVDVTAGFKGTVWNDLSNLLTQINVFVHK